MYFFRAGCRDYKASEKRFRFYYSRARFSRNTTCMAIKKMQSGVTSETYGLFVYGYKTKSFPNGKDNALGWMNYTIGYLKYIRQDKKKDALPYLYTAATKYNSATKTIPDLYQMLGVYYFTEGRGPRSTACR